ncbi:MAG TPA: hypothetical protein VGL86_29485 [Polyangia bacterium]
MRTKGAAATIVLIAAAAAANEPSKWERLFSAEGGPAVHASARYRDAAGNEHRLELWRTPRALRRDTDEKLAMIVERRHGSDDEYHVVQLGQNGRAYDVSRDSLYRMGSFPEWSQLATMLTRPAGELRIDGGAEATTTAGACRWYEVTRESARERICWSRAMRLPLVIERWVSGAWARTVTVERAKVERIAATVFHPQFDVAHIDIDRDLD